MINLNDYDLMDFWDLAALASEPTTPPEALSRLSVHGSPHIRTLVAKNISIPPEACGRLAHDEDTEVKLNALINPNLPQNEMKNLIDRFFIHEGNGLITYLVRLIQEHKHVSLEIKNYIVVKKYIYDNLETGT